VFLLLYNPEDAMKKLIRLKVPPLSFSVIINGQTVLSDTICDRNSSNCSLYFNVELPAFDFLAVKIFITELGQRYFLRQREIQIDDSN